MRRLIPFVCAAALATGCGSGLTDVISTSVEGVGDYELVNVMASDTFAATVCAARPGNAETIAERIVMQLKNHHYRSVRLDIVAAQPSADAPVTHVVWTPDRALQVIGRGTTAQDRCSMHNGRVMTPADAGRAG